VLHSVSLASGATVNSGVDGLFLPGTSIRSPDLLPVRGRFAVPAATLLPLGRAAVDLAIFDTRARTTTRLGLSLVSSIFPFDHLVRFFQGDGYVAVSAEELIQQADLNGDGDRNDSVLQLVDIATGRVTNVGRAVFADLFDVNTGRQGRGDAYAFVVSELDQGGVDLTGDGDLDDAVLHVTLLEDRDRDGIFDFADGCVGRGAGCAGADAD
jgi:hypothetical protein